MSNAATIVVLCEDQQSRVFAERALVRRGYDRRGIRVEMAPPGAQSAEQYVREAYPRQVRFLRTRAATKGLLVHVDADPGHSVAGRHAELAASLLASGQSARKSKEPIAELVPKRNIETWIHALDETLSPGLARPLDEEQAYPKFDKHQSRCALAAVAFAEHARANTVPDAAGAVPSLLDGIEEFRRLP